jgi:hypothetical protein
VDVTVALDAPHPASAVFPWIADLSCYPSWLDIVRRAEADDTDAWLVDLRGRLGPLARSKRLRMVRTAHEPGQLVRFERAELDGRSHSRWVLDASVEDVPDGSRLTVHLHYSGSLFGPVLERVLGEEIERSRSKLLACVADDL